MAEFYLSATGLREHRRRAACSPRPAWLASFWPGSLPPGRGQARPGLACLLRPDGAGPTQPLSTRSGPAWPAPPGAFRSPLRCAWPFSGSAAFAKADSTLRSSRAVPRPSTSRSLRRLTLEVRRDPAHSTRHGRRRCSSLPFLMPRLPPCAALPQEVLNQA